MTTRTQLLEDPKSGARALSTSACIRPAPVIADFEPEDVYRAGTVWEALRSYCTDPGRQGDETDFFDFACRVI